MTMSPDFQELTEKIAQEMFESACSAQKAGDLPEAHRQYRFLIEHFPESSLLHYNLGLVYYEQTDFQHALEEFFLADQLAPEDADTLFNLALCQKKAGDCLSAIDTYRHILQLDPQHADSLYNLGGCYRDQYDDEQAIACYQAVLTLNPSHASAANTLAYVHHRAGDTDLAIHYYQQILEKQPQNESIRYLLSALLSVHCDTAPDTYVRDFFNSYASKFEHNLVLDLGYDTPQRLYDCLGRSEVGKMCFQHGLDLGCGTGLSGLAFTSMVTRLDGVDLSDRMLIQARDKGCYNQIHPDSILHHLASTKESYDFFLATDVFIYVGDLLPVFSLAWDIATPDALFCFSTERLDAENFRLLPTGRFAYSPAYIHQAAAKTGWITVHQESAPLRRERNTCLTGDLWILQRMDSFE